MRTIALVLIALGCSASRPTPADIQIVSGSLDMLCAAVRDRNPRTVAQVLGANEDQVAQIQEICNAAGNLAKVSVALSAGSPGY